MASEAVPVRAAGEMYQLFNPSGEARLTDKFGGVVSRRIVPLVEAVFPATSETVAVKLYMPFVDAANDAPPPLMLGNPETPDVASVAEAEAVTGPDTNQPFSPLAGGMDMERLGGVVSSLVVLETVALFPATSLAWNSITCAPPGVLRLVPEVHAPPSTRYRMVANPEVASEPEPVKATGELYQLFSPLAGGTDTERLGGVVSSLIVPLVEALFPALSVVVTFNAYVPSADAVNVLLPALMFTLFTPEVASVAEAEAVTGPDTNQPFSPSAGGMVSVGAGATLSTIIEAEAIVDVSPKVVCTQ
ncbi:MAG: hypothetical protein WC832_02030 [Anaerolineales bacterium]